MLPGSKQIRRLKILDNIFRRIIITSGIVVIICVLLVLWSILKVSLPLFKSNETNKKILKEEFYQNILYVETDTYFETFFVLTKDGKVILQNLENKKILDESVISNEPIIFIESASPQYLFSRFQSSAAKFWQISSTRSLSETSSKEYQLKIKQLGSFPPLPTFNNQQIFYDAARRNSEDVFIRVSLIDKKIFINLQAITENFLGDEEKIQENLQITSKLTGKITAAFLTRNASRLYISNDKGEIEDWDLRDLSDIHLAFTLQTKKNISSINTIFGDSSLLVGFTDGKVETFSYNKQKLLKIYDFDSETGAIKKIIPSLRNKSFLIIGENKSSFLYLTATNKIVDLDLPKEIKQISFNENGSSIALLEKNQISFWKFNAPHPEFSLSAIFDKIHYENYSKPDYIWQSSSGHDDFEPKYSFIPLIIGSIKGTLYAMIFALPLAILGAIYVNQFAKHWLRKIIKPTVEIMATIPSVAIGFLAALWLSPLIEKYLLSMLLYLVVFPLFFISSFWLYIKFSKNFSKKFGKEFLLVIPSFIGCLLFVTWVSPLLNKYFFGNDFIFWLSNTFGLVYEQRNAIVISFALGFAIIPIIFTMTDEALSSFPKSLKAASLALGANQWQTLTKVILPTTASGIFAGFIIGFGRAIGETMIVLMATGNSPITSWSVFNGMRTIAANIAVEVPEAPFEGTLYRVLFLSAVILFLFTFSLNLIAELIRSKLRKKYKV